MTTYVYSTNPRARLAHLPIVGGRGACGIVLAGAYQVAENLPPRLTVCARCVTALGTESLDRTAKARADVDRWITRWQKVPTAKVAYRLGIASLTVALLLRAPGEVL